jgi:hypothetical protein
VTELQELVKQLDEYFADPGKVSSDGALTIAKDHLKTHRESEVTVSLTESQAYGVSGSAGEKDVKAGGSVSMTRGITKVLFPSRLQRKGADGDSDAGSDKYAVETRG